MRRVFVDTSGLYAFLDRDDSFHAEAKQHFLESESGALALVNSSYVTHESRALIQAGLGWVGGRLPSLGAAHACEARERRWRC